MFKIKKIIRKFYHQELQIYYEKFKFFNKEIKSLKKYYQKFSNKTALEIGGPSFFLGHILKYIII